jgi:hypothetical protein
VPAFDLRVEVFQQPRVLTVLGARVAGQLEEVELVRDRDRARQVREEDRARLERGDEDGVLAFVVAGDFGAELADARGDLRGREVNVADAGIAIYQARVSLYRWARRSISRL